MSLTATVPRARQSRCSGRASWGQPYPGLAWVLQSPARAKLRTGTTVDRTSRAYAHAPPVTVSRETEHCSCLPLLAGQAEPLLMFARALTKKQLTNCYIITIVITSLSRARTAQVRRPAPRRCERARRRAALLHASAQPKQTKGTHRPSPAVLRGNGSIRAIVQVEQLGTAELGKRRSAAYHDEVIKRARPPSPQLVLFAIDT